MPRLLKSTLAVLLVTGLTAGVIIAVVVLFGGAYVQGDLTSAYAQSGSASGAQSGQLMTCPRTGCTETYCHATGQGSSSSQGQQGQSHGYGNGRNGGTQGYSQDQGGQSYQYGQSGSSDEQGSADSQSGQLMTCPRTGCTETYCHATGQGSSGQGGNDYNDTF